VRLSHISLAASTQRPHPLAKSEYEIHLEQLAVLELLHEYESAMIDFAFREAVGTNCERTRMCKRELARRLFSIPGTAA
jgi:hypothetical protein